MNGMKDRSYIGSALKHHSRAQTAIKLLQEQLECLDRIRESTKNSFVWSDEKGLEKSTNDLLLSTSRVLIGSGNEPSDEFSSTLGKCVALKDQSVIRNLLPTFDEVKDTKPLFNNDVSPIKACSPDRARYGCLTPQTKDSLASITLPLTPYSVGISSPNLLNSSLTSKNMSPSKLNLPPTNMNLTEALAKVSYGSMLSGSTDDMANSSDELFSLLEKISGTAEHLRNELNDARTKESQLIEELERLRPTKNGYSSRSSPVSLPSSVRCHKELELKCTKLEDALLSLQDENMKLNRLLKGQETISSVNEGEAIKKLEKALFACEKDNKNLNAKIQSMTTQLELYEKQFSQQNESTRDSHLSVDDLKNSVAISERKKNESIARLEEKIRRLEKELHHALCGMGDNKDLQTQINQLHRSLLEKDNQMKHSESSLREVVAKKEEAERKYEVLQKHDVYKRKEVIQLCDKFEKMRSRHRKLEAEFVAVRAKDQAETTKKWAMQDSLHKLFKENEALQNKLISEQRQLTMGKLLLEKDYQLLKKRYDEVANKVAAPGSVDSTRSLQTTSVYGRTANVGSKPPVRQHNVANQFNSPPSDPHRRLRMKSTATETHQRPQSTQSAPGHPVLDNMHQESLRSLRNDLGSQRCRTLSPENPSRHRPLRSRSSEYQTRTCDSSLVAMATSTPKRTVAAKRIHYTPIPRHVDPAPEQSPREYKKQDGNSQLGTSVQVNTSSSGTGTYSSPAQRVEDEQQQLVSARRSSEVATKMSPIKSASMSLLDSRNRKIVYEEEYMRNMKALDKSASTPDHGIDCMSLRNSSTLDVPPAKAKLPRQRRRFHTTPSVLPGHLKGIQFISEDGIAYGESPYSKEYLSNMDGVRLVANLSQSSNSNESQLRKTSPVKSILKSSARTSGDSSQLASVSAPELSKAQSSKALDDKFVSSTKSELRSSSFPHFNDTKASNTGSAPDSKSSGRSFHLSDLPSDQTDVYDKFRNFDSHVRDYGVPEPQLPSQNEADSPKEAQFLEKQKDAAKPNREVGATIARHAEPSKVPPPRSCGGQRMTQCEEDSDSVGQSSASTTRDHAGRIEFLRDMQINTGVRMPALMRDVTIRSDVLVEDDDLTGEIRVGLTDNQEEYADKLVKKYTKHVKKCGFSLMF